MYQQPTLTGSHFGCARLEAAILDKRHHSCPVIVYRQPSWISRGGDEYKWRGKEVRRVLR